MTRHSTQAIVTLLLSAFLIPSSARAQTHPVRVSGPSPFAACPIFLLPGETDFLNGEVEPWVTVNPTDPNNVVGVWQQDRFTSGGGARGQLNGVSHDGGQTWTRVIPRLTNCAGGTAQNAGNYERATDPWVTSSPKGVLYQSALSFDIVASAREAVLVARSSDGGDTWSDAKALIYDTDPTVGDDKDSITADPLDARYVYATWDRYILDASLVNQLYGPTWFARTTNGGESWESARIIYDPGYDAQTISNQIVVLPDGRLVNLFVRILHFNEGSPAPEDVTNMVMFSYNKGLTWSAPVEISISAGIGVVDPKTGDALRTGDTVPGIAVDRRSGALYVVWEDARFSGGAREGVVLSKSTDAGHTWSAPVQLNRVPTVQAHTPAVAVADDGTVAVTYYDFRKDTPNPAVYLSDYWQLTSHDRGQTWNETHLAGSFNMLSAVKDDGGYFLGDYQSLAHRDESFLPFFVIANSGNVKNPTDVFASLSGEQDNDQNNLVEVNAHPRSVAERLKYHRDRRWRP